MINPIVTATVRQTGEAVNVYRLRNGNFYDADAISEFKQPTARVANKKEFKWDELQLPNADS